MLYEKHVGSFNKLMKEVRMLDSDAGIRLLGTYKGKKCFVFVSRSAKGYAAVVCSVRTAGSLPGRRILASEFDGVRGLQGFLKRLSGRPLEAYVY